MAVGAEDGRVWEMIDKRGEIFPCLAVVNYADQSITVIENRGESWYTSSF
jgi:MoaA/NifB/PqqE/SkfB family radical SAM enzyme